MRSITRFGLVALALSLAACEDDPINTGGVDTPPPPAEGIQAFLQVSHDRAEVGQQVEVFVRVQMGTKTPARLGSYTGRLKFDPEALHWIRDMEIADGLRVINPNGAGLGEIRFAGASAKGFDSLLVYHGVFEVKEPAYLTALALEMEELSAALTLQNLKAKLEQAPHVFSKRGVH
jgi:hypothetical protein